MLGQEFLLEEVENDVKNTNGKDHSTPVFNKFIGGGSNKMCLSEIGDEFNP